MVTQEHIAQKLGVSRQLVTFALAGYPQVAESSRRRILNAAREMGYQPNPHARALRRKHTGIIALWIPDQVSTHYNHVARELGRLVKQARRELIVSEVGKMEARQILSHVPVDGVIAVDVARQVDACGQIPESRSVPIVSMGADCSEATDFVRVDLRGGTAVVMQHLYDSGYRRIAHATFVQKNGRMAGRRMGYLEAMQKYGLKPEFIYYPFTDRQRPVARQLVQEYIRKRGRPEAIFCHSDDAALGIYRGLMDLNLRVPEDLALVGCDGIEDVDYLERPLTTLVQPVESMCLTAWKFLMNRLEQPGLKNQSLVLKPVLSVRESSRPAAINAFHAPP